MDAAFRETLGQGVAALSLPVDARALELLERYADRLLAWNRKVNLTAITAPVEVAEKHLVDSLAVLPSLGTAKTLLDLGAGAGLPGVALACARPELQVTCCDSVSKKVAFVKAVAVELGLENVRGVAARATGNPDADRLPRADAVISRALTEPDQWLGLAKPYLAAGGVVLAMLGREADDARLAEVGVRHGLQLEGVQRFELPLTRATRAVARWRVG